MTLFEEELALLHDKNLHRCLRRVDSLKGIRAKVEGRNVTLFCGNDYLGLAQHVRVKKAMQVAIDDSGCGAGAARLIAGNSPYHEQLENKIAAFKQKPRALIYSAGYLANLGVLSALANEEDLIVMDKWCHASLIDGARLSGATLRVFPHKNYERCEEILQQAGNYRRRLLVSDTVFSMDGDLADLNRLIILKKKFDALLIVDDAHGTGVLGQTGKGALEDGDFAKDVDVITGTLSKTLGVLGGYAAASETLVDYFINFSRSFIFATALPPSVCAAAYESIHLIETEPNLRQKLWFNLSLMWNFLKKSGWELSPSVFPILPLLIGPEAEALKVSEALFEAGFFVPAIRTPTVPKGKARLRLTVSALHEAEDIRRFVEALKNVHPCTECGIMQPQDNPL